ncbi:peptide deformylase [Peteryoungia desertarenae]|uniref:Peptide deformylase-like n=1 Tax=Peteryoungia desertarenae TaxID=1813451 RepID=A0ABX6QPW1_9HYPH|nr:peptide deformylase [Peteryoungia desertarenae]QLF70558.1 peptide deformylase [Peteryoungia desertarenae]
MTVSTLTIRRYPDAALATPCLPVSSFDEDLKSLVDALYHTMKAAPGVGITAAHCGLAYRIVVIELDELGGRCDYINPELIWSSPEQAEFTEGSVSMPGVTETVTRPRHVRIRYQDLSGHTHEESLTGFPAICMQHEIDQLDGIFWLQRLSRLKRERLIKKWQKLNR